MNWKACGRKWLCAILRYYSKLSRRDWEKPQKLTVCTTGLRTEIQCSDLPKTESSTATFGTVCLCPGSSLQKWWHNRDNDMWTAGNSQHKMKTCADRLFLLVNCFIIAISVGTAHNQYSRLLDLRLGDRGSISGIPLFPNTSTPAVRGRR
jgi:hypothetical protein